MPYSKEVPLGEVLKVEQVLSDMTNRSKKAAIEDLVEVLWKQKLVPNKSEALTRVLEREELVSTALGDGVAIPHARLEVGPRPVIAIGRHTAGIDFDAPDGKPVHLIFLVLWQPERPGLFNRLFGGLVSQLANPRFRARLIEARDPEEIAGILADVRVSMLSGTSATCDPNMLFTLQMLETKKRGGAKGLERQMQLARDELPGSVLSRFDRLLDRLGEAFVEATDGVCKGCNVQLSSSFASEMLKNPDTVYVCERCGRFMIHHFA